MGIASLPGRNGFDLNLNLHYSSRVWTVDKVNSTATFNADRDFPSYGFRLGFGYLEYDPTSDIYVLTEADGTKRRLIAGASGYDSDDNSFINFGGSVLRYKNGTQVLYEAFPDAAFSATHKRPTKITDTNGNYITITYATGTGRNQDISTIADTLGRVITFNYDANQKLTSITQGAKTHATFTWGTVALNYSFTGLTTPGTSPSGTSLNVLTSCTYANGTKYNFIYGDWGIVRKIERKSSSNAVRSYVSYNYPASTPALSDHPTWNTETSFDGVNTLISTYSVTKTGGVVSSYTVTAPSGTKTVTNLLPSGFLSSVEIKDAANTTLRRTTTAPPSMPIPPA